MQPSAVAAFLAFCEEHRVSPRCTTATTTATTTPATVVAMRLTDGTPHPTTHNIPAPECRSNFVNRQLTRAAFCKPPSMATSFAHNSSDSNPYTFVEGANPPQCIVCECELDPNSRSNSACAHPTTHEVSPTSSSNDVNHRGFGRTNPNLSAPGFAPYGKIAAPEMWPFTFNPPFMSTLIRKRSCSANSAGAHPTTHEVSPTSSSNVVNRRDLKKTNLNPTAPEFTPYGKIGAPEMSAFTLNPAATPFTPYGKIVAPKISSFTLNPAAIPFTPGALAYPSSAATQALFEAEQTRTFHQFMHLPDELRELVYEKVLVSDQSIRPQLCSYSDGNPRFHDQNQTAHNATRKLLEITAVSKKVREESLPVFYKKNTFEYGSCTVDTLTYFLWLKKTGRFEMIRRVRFNVPQQRNFEGLVAKVVSGVQSIIAAEKQDEHERHGQSNTWSALRQHPYYQVGGVQWAGIFILMRMLSSPLPDSSTHKRQIVLRVPRKTIFEDYNLAWFLKAAEKLKIEIKLIEGADTGLNFQWLQKYQKKDFEKDYLTIEKRKGKGKANCTGLTTRKENPKSINVYYRVRCKTHSIHGARAAYQAPEVDWAELCVKF